MRYAVASYAAQRYARRWLHQYIPERILWNVHWSVAKRPIHGPVRLCIDGHEYARRRKRR